MSAIASTTSGTVAAALIHNRRCICRSSGLGASGATSRGSRAMPQIGQAPGPSRTTSGCIGHVHFPERAGAGAAATVVAGGRGRPSVTSDGAASASPCGDR